MNNKLKKLNSKISTNIKIYKNFGFKMGCLDLCNSIFFRKIDTSIGKFYHKKRYEAVKDYLMKNDNVINNYKNSVESNKISNNCPIFVFWWQGFNNAPEIVKSCFKSVERHKGTHKVIAITKDNWFKYADIPDFIINKVKSGTITLTHFSDILRVALLYKNGGIWIDATLYLTKDIPSNLNNFYFYTVKHNLYKEFHICKGLWQDSFLASGKNNLLMKYMYDSFINYWKRENMLIAYLLIDSFFAIAYENIIEFKKEIDAVPTNNENINYLMKMLNTVYSKEIEEKLLSDSTYIFKTTYRVPFKKDVNGTETLYNKIINNKI